MTTDRYGFEKIAKAEAQIWLADDGSVEYAIVWAVAKSGDVFSRSIRIGEDPESVAKALQARGSIDEHCVLHSQAA